jgi:hypothetical protein
LTDNEFLKRLKQELTNGTAWPDIAGVSASADEPDLFANELRVYPIVEDPMQLRVSAFRLLCEWEVRPRRAFPPPLPSSPRPSPPP